MACAALKRPHNFDLLATNNSPEQLSLSASKRRRCGASATSVSPATVSPFLEATPKVYRDDLTKCVHDEWRRLHRRRKLMSPPHCPAGGSSSSSSSSNIPHSSLGSPTHHTSSGLGSPTHHPSSFWSSPQQQPHTANMSPPPGGSSPTGLFSPTGSMSPPRGKEASFTIKQVVTLCERLWKEREEKLREEYDQVLHEKLGEQYDSFLKFTQDQIIRKYQQSSCSYVS